MNYYDLEPARQQAESLSRLLRYLRRDVARYHPYLRRLYREQRIDVTRLRTPGDLVSLPLIRKDQLRAEPLMFVLQPRSPGAPPLPEGYDTEPLPAPALAKYVMRAALNFPRDHSPAVQQPAFREKVIRRGQMEWLPVHYHASTGSTGEPTPVMFTWRDLHRIVGEMAQLAIRHKNPGPDYVAYKWTDRWMSLMPAAPHVAFFSAVLAKILVGTPGFETFGGAVIPTDRQLELFARGGFSTLIGIPSYVTYWLRRARVLQQQGAIGPFSGLVRLLVGAEPVSESLREHIRKLALEVGADRRAKVIQSYGMTEFKWIFYECYEGAGIHLNPKYYYWELLHPESLRPVEPGEPGVLVFSHVGWRGTTLIRYWTGDLIKGGMRWDRCPHCGYTFPRIFPPICRADKDFTKIKGTRVDLSLLTETVRDTAGVRRFQIVLENENREEEFSRDVVAVHVVAEPGASRSDLELLIAMRTKHATELSPDRIVFEENEAEFEKRLFGKNGVKAEYILERRQNAL
jgi:phenylacetate-coenzyme A ligase PaaK-like adenylate-forming protein